MPGPITYAAISLLARDRIRQIRDALRAKEKNGRTVNDIERQIRYLAEQAFTAMSNATPTLEPPVTLYGTSLNNPVGDQVSKFLLMGAVGPELPGYAALFTNGQSWLRDTIHKGTPDANREQVLAGSCNLGLSFWNKVQPLISAEFAFSAPNTPEQKRYANARLGMQAYVLGHFCHVAADVVSAPFIDNLEWRLGSTAAPARAKMSRAQIIGALETEVSKIIFRRGTETRGNNWVDWWPTKGQVPDAFFTAYHQALEQTYGPGAVRAGLAAFETRHAEDAPPPLSEALLQDGYASFRTVVDTGAAWDYWDWLGATWFMFLPSFAAYPLAMTLQNGKDYFRDVKPPDYDEGKAMFELIGLPFALNSLVPLYYSIVASVSYLGAESEVIVGWVSTGVQVAAAISFFATRSTSKDALPWRWALIFGVPLALYALHIGFTLHRGASNPRRMQLLFASILPVVLSFVFIGFYWAFLHTGIEKMQNPDPDKEPGEFVWRLFVWFTILFGLWWLTALVLRKLISPELPADVADDIIGKRGHHLRLFDDATLYLQPRATSPTLADLFYPSGRRALLKIWWNGEGDATIIAHRDKLEFDIAGHPATVPAPLAATKLSEFADYLQRNVKNATGQAMLKAEIFAAEALDVEDYELPPGLVFSDEGDNETTVEVRAVKLGVPQRLRKSTEDPYVLYHAPKVLQSVRFDRRGPALDSDETTAAVDGIGTVNNPAGSHQVTMIPGPNVTRFTQLFRPGDLIEAPQGGRQRMVISVDSDIRLTIATPFPAALAGATFRRAAQNRRMAQAPPGPAWQIQTVQGDGYEVQGLPAANSQFGAIFRPGDTITVKPGGVLPDQSRVVMEVISDSRLMIASPFDPPLAFPNGAPAPAPATFERAGAEPDYLLGFPADGDDTLESGDSIMNHAADMAALLCLGATSQLLAPGDLAKTRMGTANDLNRVYQVFRNWNLDRRRVNEWKMLILGGAVSEKRGDPRAIDATLPPLSADWALYAENGEKTLNSMGWLNILRNWTEMARSPASDTKASVAFRPGNPTNLELSRAMAFLFDMRDPA